MARRKGTPKTGGRKPGTPNKSTDALFAACKARGFDCFDRLLEFCEHPDPSLAFAAVKEACSYLYAKRKAIEVSEDPDSPVAKAATEYLEKLKELHAKAAKERKRG